MDALMWRCAGWAGRGIIHHPPLAGGPPSSAEKGEEGAWGVGTAGRAGGEGECFCAVARGKTIGNFLFKKDAFYSSKNTAGKVFLKKNHR